MKCNIWSILAAVGTNDNGALRARYIPVLQSIQVSMSNSGSAVILVIPPTPRVLSEGIPSWVGVMYIHSNPNNRLVLVDTSLYWSALKYATNKALKGRKCCYAYILLHICCYSMYLTCILCQMSKNNFKMWILQCAHFDSYFQSFLYMKNFALQRNIHVAKKPVLPIMMFV